MILNKLARPTYVYSFHVINGIAKYTQYILQTWHLIFSFITVFITATNQLICFRLFNVQYRYSYFPEVSISHDIFSALDFQIVKENTNINQQDILVIRLHFLLDALHVSDYISPSSGTTFISCTSYLVYADIIRLAYLHYLYVHMCPFASYVCRTHKFGTLMRHESYAVCMCRYLYLKYQFLSDHVTWTIKKERKIFVLPPFKVS